MSVNYAILTLLQRGAMSGYDLKKAIQASAYMPWSGNNNQVYKALAQLCAEGLLAGETLHREDAPTKKLYRLTEAGQAALRAWVQATVPEAPGMRGLFLIQLEAAAGVAPALVSTLLAQYRAQVHNEWTIQNEMLRRKREAAGESAAWIQGVLADSVLRFYRSEVDWADAALLAASAAERKDDRHAQD